MGPTGAGKTTCYRMLAAVMTDLRKKGSPNPEFQVHGYRFTRIFNLLLTKQSFREGQAMAECFSRLSYLQPQFEKPDFVQVQPPSISYENISDKQASRDDKSTATASTAITACTFTVMFPKYMWASSTIGKLVKYEILNPKCITMGELYGEFSALTQEWHDGLASTIMRRAVADEGEHRRCGGKGRSSILWILR